jgi:hypothetical protein
MRTVADSGVRCAKCQGQVGIAFHDDVLDASNGEDRKNFSHHLVDDDERRRVLARREGAPFGTGPRLDPRLHGSGSLPDGDLARRV